MSGPCSPLIALLQLPNDSKSIRRISHVRIIPEAGRGTQVFRRAIERAPAQDPEPTLPREPWRAILGGAPIVIVPAVLHPLSRIACGVVQTEGIRLV